MTLKKWSLRAAALCAGALALSACATSTTTVTPSTPVPYEGPATVSGPTLIQQGQAAAQGVKPSVVFMVGEFKDETGKHLDTETVRYSRAVTQASAHIAADSLRRMGFQVAERNPFNMGLLAQEYSMSHTFTPVLNAQGQPVRDEATGQPMMRNIGLIQRGGPDGGLVAANYMLTGAIVSYSSSTQVEGGGVDYDGIGVSGRDSEATVGVVVRIVEVSSGLTVSSLYLESKVTGSTRSLHITRFIGDVVSTLATVTGGTAATTILRPTSDHHIASAEWGGSSQLPIDHAVIDAIVASITRQVEVNQHLFYEAPIRPYDYNVGAF